MTHVEIQAAYEEVIAACKKYNDMQHDEDRLIVPVYQDDMHDESTYADVLKAVGIFEDDEIKTIQFSGAANGIDWYALNQDANEITSGHVTSEDPNEAYKEAFACLGTMCLETYTNIQVYLESCPHA
jgi:hypothetical protein